MAFEKQLYSLVSTEILKIDELGLSPNNKQSILESLANLSKFAFDQDFTDFSSKRIPGFSILRHFNKSFKNSSVLLDQYADYWQDGVGEKNFLRKFPVIKKVLKEYCDQKCDFLKELNRNLFIDKEELSAVFNESKPLGDVLHLKFMGDTHQCGRAATVISFNSAKKLVYKPRSGALDVSFNLLLESLNLDVDIRLKGIKTIDKINYCWTEYIEPLPCSSPNGVKDYYQRCGALLAICYLLRGTDFHFENIIANGDYPVLVDLECLFAGVSNESTFDLFTVYSTGLVPFIDAQDNKDHIDYSGWGAFGKKESLSDYVWDWVDLNSDAVRLEKRFGHFNAENNQPVYAEKKIDPNKYLNEIICGFKSICNLFVLNKKHLNNNYNPFKNFENKEFRILLRRTRDYQLILENSIVPISLSKSKQRRKDIFDDLNKFSLSPFLHNKLREFIIQKELESIESLSIPYFIANTSSLYLKESDSVVTTAFFKTSPYAFVLNKIKGLSRNDIEYQVALIKTAFTRRYSIQRKNFKRNYVLKKAKSYDKENVLYEAIEIANQIKGTAFIYGKEFLWNCYGYEHNGRFTYDFLKGQLYAGKLGIAFFLSSLSNYTKNADYNEIIQYIIDAESQLCFDLMKSEQGDSVDLSFCTGIAGLIYILIAYASYKDETNALRNALLLSELIKFEDTLKDKNFDILYGNSGLLLVLILLFEKSRSLRLLTVIKSLGDSLLENRIIDPESGYLAWMGATCLRPLTGISHGASGIAFSLLRLYESTGEQKYKEAFYEAIKFENYYANVSEKNWADLRTIEKNYQVSWCHGAPGIGLVRLHAFRILNDSNFINDIDIAVETTKNNLVTGIDHYCCGNVGRIDFLIEASIVLNRSDLLDIAENAISEILQNKNNSGYYRTFEHPDLCLENLSLFKGTSGIGYILLRSIEPKKFPCFGLLY